MTPALATRLLGEGRPVLFLHGLGGSRGYWGGAFDGLASAHRLAFVDLAGFGESIGVAGPYDVDGHLARLDEVRRRHLDGDGLVVVGHSFGSVVALAASARWPEVTGMVGFGLPAFRSPAEATAHLRNLGPMERWLATGAWPARLACWAVCHARPLARLVAPLLAGDVPRHVASDGVEHTWRAYEGSFRSLVEDARVREWVAARPVPRVVVQGTHDRVCPPEVACDVLAGLPVDVRVVEGDHHLPLRRPDRCVAVVEELLAATAR